MKVLLPLLLIVCLFRFDAFAQLPLTDSLIAYYPFNGNALDSSGHGNNGLIFGATPTADRFGHPNSAYYFDGAGDFISLLQADSSFTPKTFPVSVCCWIKSKTVDEFGTIFKNNFIPDRYSGIGFGVQIDSGGVLEVRYGDGGVTGPCCRRSKFGHVIVNDYQWHFIAGVIRGATDMDLYVDCKYDTGSYDGTGYHIYNSPYTGGCSGKIDAAAGTFYFKGAIDDIRFYHRELTLQDLQLLHDTPMPYVLTDSSVSLGLDTFICPGEVVKLNPAVIGAASTYLWSDGSTDSVLHVSDFGTYWVTVTDVCGFTATDTIVLTKSNIQPVNLGNDTIVCEGQFLILDAGSGYDTYLWSNGVVTSSIAVFSSGTYWVTATKQGCVTSDTINVDFQYCLAMNDPSGSGVKLLYDAGAHCFNILLAANSLPASGRLILYNTLGARLLDQPFDCGQGAVKVYLQHPLIPACYFASVQAAGAVFTMPVIVTQ